MDWFTADTHLCHEAIIKYQNRPCTFEEMDTMIVNNINSCVKKHDNLYIIGDFCLSKDQEKLISLIKRLNGNKFIIFGNHDSIARKEAVKKNFAGSWDYKKIKINDQMIVMSHYPMISWEQRRHGAWMLHGHSHGRVKHNPRDLILDVGLDPNNMMPISFEQIKEIMDNKAKIKPITFIDIKTICAKIGNDIIMPEVNLITLAEIASTNNIHLVSNSTEAELFAEMQFFNKLKNINHNGLIHCGNKELLRGDRFIEDLSPTIKGIFNGLTIKTSSGDGTFKIDPQFL